MYSPTRCVHEPYFLVLIMITSNVLPLNILIHDASTEFRKWFAAILEPEEARGCEYG